MSNQTAFRIAAFLGALAVGLGAFGAHGLKDVLVQNKTSAIWEKAVFYQFIHVLVMLFLAQRSPLQVGPWVCFVFGIVAFSGSLYLMALTNIKWLGAITPFGGISFIVGWVWLFVCPLANKSPG